MTRFEIVASIGLTLTLVVGGCAPVTAPATVPQERPGAQQDHAVHFKQLLDDEWQWVLREFPALATYVGDTRYDDRLTDLSLEAIARRKEHARDLVRRLDAIDRSRLGEHDRLNYDLFRRATVEDVEGEAFPSEVFQISQRGGVYSQMVSLAQSIPKFRAKNYDDFIQRLRGVPRLVDQTIVLLRKGAESGVTPPRVTMRDVEELIRNHISDDPMRTPIFTTLFDDLPPSISAEDADRLRRETAAVIRAEVVPAYRRLLDFYLSEYYPRTRQTIGMSALPEGAAWYAYRVRQMTTTDRSPDEIHRLGLEEVARIRAAMETVKGETGFRGSLDEFFVFLRTDPRFFFTEKEALLAAYRDIAKRIDPGLVRLFGTLPRQPYGVLPIPAHSEKTQTTAYYSAGSAAGGRPGIFYANTYDLKSRPKWEMEALTLHEAVPGHHLQISLAQELPELPEFRRFGGFTAFVEGWGLYAESLGPELGMYQDPYSKFGQLTYEMWRAVRLVVDTGIHSKGWSRDRAIDYFRSNAGKSEHDIIVEIDRYIVTPAQALAYKLGELKIKELRAYATTALGDRFDVREFHDLVLGGGAIPLSTLDARVREWVDGKRGARSS
ncbi:MAG TPA: DUF885 domain-containing protein [Thermoanaerobaculia bacterium]|nr:DUF885 domain-containing protein [Thermoanaerobaculia bacterium]